ncbi:MAG: glycosyltransferase family 4 protein [Candidatus Sulfotelmatobacter sp.]
MAAAGLGAWGQHAETRDARKFSSRCSPGLVYFNSVASAHVIEVLAPQVPVLTHVHELESYIRAQPSVALLRLLAQTDRFITCSNATRENLTQNHGVVEQRVETVYESIPVSQTRAERTRQEVFRELHIPDEALLVVGSGFGQWRKGTDLFLQVARMVSQQRSNAYFAWIGGSTRDLLEIEHDVRLAGLAANVRFTGAVSKSADYFAAADVFVLTSREDPYPLVCLEAAALAKPIVCFADAGGMPEFVEEDCGFVVPYLDLTAMADRIFTLLDSSECRVAMGAAARRKVTERHDTGRAAPLIMEIIERTLAVGDRRDGHF